MAAPGVVVPEFREAYTKYARFSLSDFLDMLELVNSALFADWLAAQRPGPYCPEGDVILRHVKGGYNVTIRFGNGGVARGRADHADSGFDLG